MNKSAFLDEALALGIVNISALARSIKPEVEREAMKNIQEGAVVVALNRLVQRIEKKLKRQRTIFRNAPDLIVRSNLVEMTYASFYQSQGGAMGQNVYIEGKKEFRYSIRTRSGHHILILFQGTGGQPEVYLEKDPNLLLEKLR